MRKLLTTIIAWLRVHSIIPSAEVNSSLARWMWVMRDFFASATRSRVLGGFLSAIAILSLAFLCFVPNQAQEVQALQATDIAIEFSSTDGAPPLHPKVAADGVYSSHVYIAWPEEQTERVCYSLTLSVAGGLGAIKALDVPNCLNDQYLPGTIVKIAGIPAKDFRVFRWYNTDQ